MLLNACLHTSSPRLSSLDDLNKIWLEGRAANKEAINVLFPGQLLAIGGTDRATIDDAGATGHILGHIVCEPASDEGMNGLSLQACRASFPGLLRECTHKASMSIRKSEHDMA